MSDLVIQELKSKWKGIRPFLRHSLVLSVAGVIYVAIGFTYATAEPTESRIVALQFALNWVDYNQWGYVFMLVGLLSIISSRWPPVSETWGYTVLTGQSAAWGLFYATGILFGDSPLTNLTGVLSWGLIAFMWWAISGLVNPDVLDMLWERIELLQNENLELHTEVRRMRNKEV